MREELTAPGIINSGALCCQHEFRPRGKVRLGGGAGMSEKAGFGKLGWAVVGTITVVTALYLMFTHEDYKQSQKEEFDQEYKIAALERAKTAWRVHVNKDARLGWVVITNSQNADVTAEDGTVYEGELGTLNMVCLPSKFHKDDPGLFSYSEGVYLTLFFIDRDTDMAPRKEEIELEAFVDIADHWDLEGVEYQYMELWGELERKEQHGGQFSNLVKINPNWPRGLMADLGKSASITFKLPWKDKYLKIDTSKADSGIITALRRCGRFAEDIKTGKISN